MAKLPPKIPNWPDFNNQKFVSPYLSSLPPAAPENNPSWVDDFLDFSSARRGNHRRSISDSITFFDSSSEPVLELECGGGRVQRASTASINYGNSSACENDNTEEYLHQFVKFDDDDEGQNLVSSMFNEEKVSLASSAPALPPQGAVAVSNPSTPSDLGSIEDVNNKQINFANGEYTGNKMPKCEANNEVESSIKSEPDAHHNSSPGTGIANPTLSESEKIVDPKRVKRILANRQSAQRSRIRKLQYISELERSVANLQAEVSALSPRVGFLDHQRLILNVDNSALKQRIAALAQDKIFKDAHQEAMKNEIERLRQVYERQQNLRNNKDNAVAPTPHTNAGSSPSTVSLSDPNVCMENEDQQLLAAN